MKKPTPVRCTERRVGDVVIIDVKGGLTLGSHTITAFFNELLDRGETKLLVNLAAVPYMDSTSVGDLIVGHLECAERGAQFKLSGLQPKMRDLLTMHHLIQVFEHHDSEEDAIASFG